LVHSNELPCFYSQKVKLDRTETIYPNRAIVSQFLLPATSKVKTHSSVYFRLKKRLSINWIRRSRSLQLVFLGPSVKSSFTAMFWFTSPNWDCLVSVQVFFFQVVVARAVQTKEECLNFFSIRRKVIFQRIFFLLVKKSLSSKQLSQKKKHRGLVKKSRQASITFFQVFSTNRVRIRNVLCVDVRITVFCNK